MISHGTYHGIHNSRTQNQIRLFQIGFFEIALVGSSGR